MTNVARYRFLKRAVDLREVPPMPPQLEGIIPPDIKERLNEDAIRDAISNNYPAAKSLYTNLPKRDIANIIPPDIKERLNEDAIRDAVSNNYPAAKSLYTNLYKNLPKQDIANTIFPAPKSPARESPASKLPYRHKPIAMPNAFMKGYHGGALKSYTDARDRMGGSPAEKQLTRTALRDTLQKALGARYKDPGLMVEDPVGTAQSIYNALPAKEYANVSFPGGPETAQVNLMDKFKPVGMSLQGMFNPEVASTAEFNFTPGLPTGATGSMSKGLNTELPTTRFGYKTPNSTSNVGYTPEGGPNAQLSYTPPWGNGTSANFQYGSDGPTASLTNSTGPGTGTVSYNPATGETVSAHLSPTERLALLAKHTNQSNSLNISYQGPGNTNWEGAATIDSDKPPVSLGVNSNPIPGLSLRGGTAAPPPGGKTPTWRLGADYNIASKDNANLTTLFNAGSGQAPTAGMRFGIPQGDITMNKNLLDRGGNVSARLNNFYGLPIQPKVDVGVNAQGNPYYSGGVQGNFSF